MWQEISDVIPWGQWRLSALWIRLSVWVQVFLLFTGWKKQRLSPVTRALVRLAGYEMMFMEDVPGKVSINEAIELSKKYDDEKTYSFINGVLNALAKEYKS